MYDFKKYQIKLMMCYYNRCKKNNDIRSQNDILLEWIKLYSKKVRDHWNDNYNITDFYD